MTTTLTRGATVLTLSDNVLWSDEFDWQAVEQQMRYSLTGAVILESGARLTGRSITLQGEDFTRAMVLTLNAWKAFAGQQFTLLYRAVTHNVVFDHERGAMSAVPLWDVSDPVAADYYACTLRFIEV